MSTQYKNAKDVPTAIICKRLDELAEAVTKGRDAVEREFVMRIPAELDYCPDLVLSEAARRLSKADMTRIEAIQHREDYDSALEGWPY